MEADAAVGGRDDVSALGPPGLDDPVDRARIELGPVGEDDDRGLGLGGQRGEAAAQRRARAALPVGAADALDVERVRAGHDDDAVDARCARPRRAPAAGAPAASAASAVARRRAGGEDDRVDHATLVQPASAAQRCWTFATYVSDSLFGARPSRSTTVGPALYAASARSVR